MESRDAKSIFRQASKSEQDKQLWRKAKPEVALLLNLYQDGKRIPFFVGKMLTKKIKP